VKLSTREEWAAKQEIIAKEDTIEANPIENMFSSLSFDIYNNNY